MFVGSSMKTKYIKKDNKYIKENLSSVIIYFDYFSPGVLIPKILNFELIKHIVHKLLRTLIIIIYITKAYRLIFKIELLSDDAILILHGDTTVKLIKNEGELKIVRKIKNRKAFLKEKLFYRLYKKNKSHIKLPQSKFLKGNIVESEFIRSKTFQRLILEGQIDFNQALAHFAEIKKELKILYGDYATLVHGDLGLTNIFIVDDHYFLIDYADSCRETFRFDLYILLYSIVLAFRRIELKQKSIRAIKVFDKNITSILEVDNMRFNKMENKYRTLRENRTLNVL